VNRYTFATLNYKEFGLDENTGMHDLDTLAVLLEPAGDADVIAVLEAVGCEADHKRLRLRVQAMVKELWGEPAQVFVSHELRGPLPKLTIVRLSRIDPLQHVTDLPPDGHETEFGQLRLRLDGVDRPLTVLPVHLDPFDGNVRLAWAKRQGNGTAPGRLHVKLVDSNAIWPGHPMVDWSGRLAHHSHHKTVLNTDGVRVSDLRAMAELERQGWRWAAKIAADWTATVNLHGPDSVCPTIDGFILSQDLAPALLPDTYRVYDPDPATNRPDGSPATDHKLVKVSVDFDRVAGA
jgi:hypothetical protein